MRIKMVTDPDSFKYRQFGFRLDKILAGEEPVGEIRWRTLWLRKCKHAIMTGESLDSLIAISEVVGGDSCKLDLGGSRTDSG